METLAVIPARGGSKGLPRKNLLPIQGVPLVGRAILAARAARSVRRMVVSTDDAEIAAVARRFGAEVVVRPAEISGDAASSESAILHALAHLEEAEGYRPEIVLLIQCTAPFLASGDIDGVIAEIRDAGMDSAFAAAPFHHFLWRRGPDGGAAGVNHSGGQRLRRQDLEPQHLEAGSVYAMRVDAFRQTGHRFCGRVGIFESDPERAMEIDSAIEMEKARALAPLLDATDAAMALPARLACIVFDFDGVLTDNRVYVSERGEELVACDRGDGHGISMLRELGVPMLVLSRESNPVVTARCGKLGIDCLQGVDDKLAVMTGWLAERGHDPSGVVYAGNDVNDADCLRFAGCAAGPSDAHPDVLPLLGLRLAAPGGRGAVRELCDLVAAGIRSGRISTTCAASRSEASL